MDVEVFIRSKLNPLITADALPFKASSVFNPGVAQYGDETILLLRIEGQEGISHLRVARSRNGVDGWRIDDEPLLRPALSENPFEEWGCEDPRITQVGDKEWIICYTAYSEYGPAIALAKTQDFETVSRIGIVMSPSNKDATIFPHKIGGEWVMLHRPVTGGGEHIWYASTADDLAVWGSAGVLFAERGGPWWDGARIGVGGPPLCTDDGWLLIYHGVKDMAGHPMYRLGLAMLDGDNPRKVLARAHKWVFGPEAPYEQTGQVPNTVFTCGALLKGDEVWMYYGAADTVVGLAVAKLSDLIDFVNEHDVLKTTGRTKGMVE